MGKEVAMGPEESAFDGAALDDHVPNVKSPAVERLLLRVDLQGVIARIYAGKRLITDDFYHGAPSEIGLEDIAAADLKQRLELQIPASARPCAYLPGKRSQAFHPAGGASRELAEVRVMPVYSAIAGIHP